MSIFGRMFGSKEAKVAAAIGATVAGETAMMKNAEAATRHKEETPHVEKMVSPEKALFEGAKFAADEAARQEEGGGIEFGVDSVFESSGGAKVHFEKSAGEAAKWGEVIASVTLADGTEQKFVLNKTSKDAAAAPAYEVRAPLSDIESMGAIATEDGE